MVRHMTWFGLVGLGFGMAWVDLGRFGSVWVGLGRFGSVWVGLGRFGSVCDVIYGKLQVFKHPL